jgi:Domain of unknown function (DUF4157)
MKPLADSIQRQEEEKELAMKPLADSIQREEEKEKLPEKDASEAAMAAPPSMAATATPTSTAAPATTSTATPAEKEEEIAMKPMIQTKSGESATATPDLESSIEQARGSGQPLADNVRGSMEQAFGADFSGVRVHTSSQSDQLNNSIQARAFTTGQDVFFRQGAYDPGSRGGQELLAHELTHVVQQNGSAVQRRDQK